MTDTGELFEILSNVYRRRLLLVLCQKETVEIPDGLLVRGEAEAQITQQSHGPVQSVMPASQSLETELIHVHLPKLEQACYIEWDREAHTASRGSAFEEIEPAFRVLDRNRHALPTGIL